MWLLRVVAAWLRDREFSVRVGESAQSTWHPVTSGTPPRDQLFRPSSSSLQSTRSFHFLFHEGTRLIGYADDLVVLRATPNQEEARKLEEDLEKIRIFLLSLGLSLNASKSKLMNISLAPGGHSIPGGIQLNNKLLPEVESLRYLGVTVDNRLNFNTHWIRTSASAKAAIGAIGRLVQREPRALKHLYQERVSSVFIHSLPYTPPSTQDAWRKLNGAATFCARLITNDWIGSSREVSNRAGIKKPSFLCFQQGMKALMKSLQGKQRMGLWLEREETSTGRGRRSERMRQRNQQPHQLQLKVPATHLRRWELLMPIRATRTFNSLPFSDAGLDPNSMPSIEAFTALLPALYELIPHDLRKLYFGE